MDRIQLSHAKQILILTQRRKLSEGLLYLQQLPTRVTHQGWENAMQDTHDDHAGLIRAASRF